MGEKLCWRRNPKFSPLSRRRAVAHRLLKTLNALGIFVCACAAGTAWLPPPEFARHAPRVFTRLCSQLANCSDFALRFCCRCLWYYNWIFWSTLRCFFYSARRNDAIESRAAGEQTFTITVWESAIIFLRNCKRAGNETEISLFSAIALGISA